MTAKKRPVKRRPKAATKTAKQVNLAEPLPVDPTRAVLPIPGFKAGKRKS